MVRGTGGFRRQRRRVPFLSANFPIEKRSPANNVAAYPQIADVARPRRSGTRPRSKITVLRLAAVVKVFGCRPMTTVPRTPRAGVRNPPREEIAGRRRWEVRHALSRIEAASSCDVEAR